MISPCSPEEPSLFSARPWHLLLTPQALSIWERLLDSNKPPAFSVSDFQTLCSFLFSVPPFFCCLLPFGFRQTRRRCQQREGGSTSTFTTVRGMWIWQFSIESLLPTSCLLSPRTHLSTEAVCQFSRAILGYTTASLYVFKYILSHVCPSLVQTVLSLCVLKQPAIPESAVETPGTTSSKQGDLRIVALGDTLFPLQSTDVISPACYYNRQLLPCGRLVLLQQHLRAPSHKYNSKIKFDYQPKYSLREMVLSFIKHSHESNSKYSNMTPEKQDNFHLK